VGRISIRQPTTAFGEWLQAGLDERGWERKTLAVKSEAGITSVNQIIAGLRNPSREMVEKLARALAPEDADEHTARALLNAGLKAAGFATDERGPIETILHEAGYSSDALDEDAREQLRQSMDVMVIGMVEQEKRKRGGA